MEVVKLKVPTSLSEITLEQYLEYNKILEVNEGSTDTQFFGLKMLEIFCGLPLAEGLKYKYTDIKKAVHLLSETITQKPDLVLGFKMGDTNFGFIPKLDDMTFNEFTTLETYLSDWDNINKAMAVLYRPITQGSYDKKYTIEEYKGGYLEEAMLKMPVSAVVSSMLFFWNLSKDLSIAMLKYLETEQGTNLTDNINLAQSGNGTHHSINSVREILGDLKI